MPNVKDAKHHSKRHQQHSHGEKDPREDMRASSENRPKRRPGREEPEASEADVKVVDVDGDGDGYEAASAASHPSESEAPNPSSSSADERPAVEIRFFGSELLRARFPQPFDVAEKVASDWVTGGNFDDLPIKQPLAQFAAQKGLQRAKEIEKKVLESPVTEKVAMRALTVGMKAQGMFEQIRERLNNRKKD